MPRRTRVPWVLQVLLKSARRRPPRQPRASTIPSNNRSMDGLKNHVPSTNRRGAFRLGEGGAARPPFSPSRAKNQKRGRTGFDVSSSAFHRRLSRLGCCGRGACRRSRSRLAHNTTTHTTPKAKARSIPSHALGLTTIPTIPFILQVGLVGPAGLFDRSTNAVGCPASHHNSTTPRPRSFKLTQQQAAAVWPPSTSSAPWPPPSPPWP